MRVRHVTVHCRLPATNDLGFIGAEARAVGGVGAKAMEDNIFPEAGGEVEEDAADEGEADAEPRVLQRVHPLEGQWLVDGDELVDSHADDDKNRADHEDIDQWN